MKAAKKKRFLKRLKNGSHIGTQKRQKKHLKTQEKTTKKTEKTVLVSN